MKISKQNLRDVSQLIFDGYLSHDVFFMDTYLTIRTLKTEEREQIALKFKYSSKAENFFIIIEVLSIAIISIGGIEVKDKDLMRRKLLQTSSFVVLFFYKSYKLIEKRVDGLIKFIDYFLESNESRHSWILFKNSQRIIDFYTLRRINQFQYYWVVLNYYRELAEEEKREWAKIEYMTNSICAFINPKAYKKVKNSSGIADEYKGEESKLDFRRRMISKLERSSKGIIEFEEEKDENFENLDQKVFGQLKRKDDETKNQYVERIEKTMIDNMKGNVVDDHDKQVRLYEINLLKKLLLEKRVKIETLKNVKNRKKFSLVEDINRVSLLRDGVYKEEVSILEGNFGLDLEKRTSDYYCNGVSYLDIIDEKAFSSIPDDEKKKAFELVMKVELDIEKATETFLKNLYKDNKKDNKDLEKVQELNKDLINKDSEKHEKYRVTVGTQVENLDVGLVEKDVLNVEQDKTKNAAGLASKMDVDVSIDDLVEQKRKINREKLTRYRNAIDKRILKDDSDQMFFNSKKY